MKNVFPALIVASLALVPTAFGQSSTSKKNLKFTHNGRVEKLLPPKMGLNAADKKLFTDAAVANMFEIKTSQLALKNSSSTFVKRFASEMIADHGAALAELKQLAKKKGQSIPTMLPAKQMAVYNKLSKLKGGAFDSAYQMAQKEGHAETSMKLKNYLRSGRDEDVRAYAVKIEPAVVMHYKMLQTKTTMTGPTKMTHGM